MNKQDLLKDQYEQYLIDNNIEYKKDFIPIIYWDDDCQEKEFFIDFYVELEDRAEWVQAIPHSDLRPIKKYLYAQKIAESHNIKFRGINKEELIVISNQI